jgi:hypothetical protein
MSEIIEQLWTAISQWPVIIQGACGSGLFWLLLETGRKLLSAIQKTLNKQSSKNKERLLREYIYTKLTSHSGFAYSQQGYFISFSRVLTYLIIGMVFVVIALFVGGFSRLILSIAAVGALYYFSKALSWLIPENAWLQPHTSLDRWKRVADLEQSLFGEVDQDTKKWISESETAEAAKPNKVTGANAG